MIKIPTKHGHTLVETIVYIFILVIVLLVVIGIVLSMSKTYHNVRVTRNVESSAVFAMERMTREIRNASGVDLANSTFNSSPGTLTLDSTDTAGNAMEVRFYVLKGVLQVDKNGTNVGPLTLPAVTIDSIVFSRISTTTSQAIRIVLTMHQQEAGALKSATFNSTVILRGSY